MIYATMTMDVLDTHSENYNAEYIRKMDSALDFLKLHQWGSAKNINIILSWKEAVSLVYGKKLRDQKRDTQHTIKNMFPSNGNYYYVAGKMRNSGYKLPYHWIDNLLRIEIVQTVEDYANEWANIAKSMRKYNINLNIAKMIEDYLNGEADCIHGMQNYWTKDDKPKRMSFKDVLENKGVTFEDLKNMAISTPEQNIRHRKYARGWSGRGRDRSIDLKYLPVFEGGSFLYMSASEYPNCGNGDYYCMYSPTMAFYCETD